MLFSAAAESGRVRPHLVAAIALGLVEGTVRCFEQSFRRPRPWLTNPDLSKLGDAKTCRDLDFVLNNGPFAVSDDEGVPDQPIQKNNVTYLQ